MKLQILSWNKSVALHACKGVNCEPFPGHFSKTFNIDLFADGGMGWYDGIEEDIVGQVVECEYIFPCSFLASGVKRPLQGPPPITHITMDEVVDPKALTRPIPKGAKIALVGEEPDDSHARREMLAQCAAEEEGEGGGV